MPAAVGDAGRARYCIAGAGAAGLAAARQFKASRLAFDLFEASDRVGGLWNHGQAQSVLYDSVRLISSKPLSQFSDLPMPAEWPDYLHHRQALDYLQRYADHCGLGPHIRFDTRVELARPDGENWRISTSRSDARWRYWARSKPTAGSGRCSSCRPN